MKVAFSTIHTLNKNLYLKEGNCTLIEKARCMLIDANLLK